MIRSTFLKIVSTVFLIAFITMQGFAQVEKAEACIRTMMQQSDVMGLSVAVVKNNKIIYTQSFGLKIRQAILP